ncbi:lipopolysaccharide biosynthesis protein [Hymenobacter nivis]|uniref:Polysaccharide biosynthesis protein n=1 Tax=Hymenobacter nivis TaxID=1850093 RepID=A0A2Z3GS53_9BACT|nr:polysaccharide biosynthesis protein [Hymenobacter nivis]AWM34216.1 polysaccharide biosynthesis protein [Hymenobacter nivis]
MPVSNKTYFTRGFFQRITAYPEFAKLMAWGKLASITGSAQLVVQAVSFACGILVIRLLPTKEYALYTLANTMLGTMVVLADGGITNGVMSQGARVWQDRIQMGAVLATGLDLRRKFAVGSLLIAAPALVYLLRHHDASWTMSFLLVAALIPAFLASLSGNLLEVAPRLHQDIVPLQKIQVGGNIGRLAMLCVTLFAFPWAFVAILAAGLPQIWSNQWLRKLSLVHADWHQAPDPVVRREILSIVKRLLPDAIYYCLSGQITIWLISLAGSTAAVAQIGALGRLAMGIGVFGALFGTLITPRFARLPSNSPVLLKRYLQLQAGLVIFSLGIVGGSWLFANQLLWVLGKNYAALKTEMVLNMGAGALSLMQGAAFSLCTFRGWVINPLIFIPVSILSIAAGVALFDVSTLKGIIVLNILVICVQLTMLITYSILKMQRAKREAQTA